MTRRTGYKENESSEINGVQVTDLLVLPSYMGFTDFMSDFDLYSPSLTVATNNSAILKFLRDAGIQCYEFPALGEDVSRRSLQKLKKELEKSAEALHPENIHYGFYLSNVSALYFLSRLNQHARRYFRDTDPVYEKAKVLRFLHQHGFRRALFNKFIFMSLFKIRLDIYRLADRFMLGRKFKNAGPYSGTFQKDWSDINRKRIMASVRVKSVDVIYVDNISQHYPTGAVQVAEALTRLKDSGLTVGVKPHPKIKLHNCFRGMYVYPHHIPMEVMDSFCHIIIGVYSNALVSKFSRKPAISLMNCIQGLPKNSIMTGIIKGMEKKKGVLLPRSYSEFYSLVDTVMSEENNPSKT